MAIPAYIRRDAQLMSLIFNPNWGLYAEQHRITELLQKDS